MTAALLMSTLTPQQRMQPSTLFQLLNRSQ